MYKKWRYRRARRDYDYGTEADYASAVAFKRAQARAQGRTRTGYCVYAILSLDSCLVKIGRSGNIGKRFSDLQDSNASRLVCLRTIPCESFQESVDLERGYHLEYAPYRSTGEWFRYADELVGEFPPEDAAVYEGDWAVTAARRSLDVARLRVARPISCPLCRGGSDVPEVACSLCAGDGEILVARVSKRED